jgi:hypothetical protein
LNCSTSPGRGFFWGNLYMYCGTHMQGQNIPAHELFEVHISGYAQLKFINRIFKKENGGHVSGKFFQKKKILAEM